MKIKNVAIKNFRGYSDEINSDFEDLTAFVGKNDIGKSTILEALDIFFNDGKGVTKLDKADLNVESKARQETDISIRVCFTDLPEKIVIDTTNETSLSAEYLLNSDGLLEVVKRYPNAGTPKVFICAMHPTNPECADLLTKKDSDLRKIIETRDIPCEDKTRNAAMRTAIWSYYGDDLQVNSVELDVTKGDAKPIWEKLQKYLPVYSLFQADRKNSDSDSEVQDPLHAAVKEILQDEGISQTLDHVAEIVEGKLQEVATRTLEKLREMSPDIANTLSPVIPPASSLKWADVFKAVTISGDESIPINKRGSGSKRLILLNFFRAEVERRKDEANAPGIIYAIEEPETSQHSENQKKLINALITLSAESNVQVIITTHSVLHDEAGADTGDIPAELPEGDLSAEETAEQSETLPAMEAAEAKPFGLSAAEKTASQEENDTVEKRAEETELHEETSEFLEAAEDLHSNLPASAPHGSEADGADWGFEEPVTEEAAAEPAEDEYLAADNAETLDASDEKSERTLFYELDFNELDRGLSEEERKEWNSIYASFRGRSAITGTIIGVDLYARYLPRSEARMLENKRELCAVVVPYRIPILIRESEMWELGEERPDFVLRNMVGASIDVIVTKVERTANRAQASRRQASRSQRRFFAAREDLHAVGSRITCRMLAVGPRRCLVDCYGYDLDMTQKEIRYAAIPDLRTEFHPGSEIDCIVKEYHPRTGELIVSAKETEVNPFFGAEERHPVGSRRFAMISGKYGGGVFCNLPDGVTCMCNYSYQHEDADFMVGEHVMLMVQRYDQEKLQMYGKIMSKW